jgi:hypothetical protein
MAKPIRRAIDTTFLSACTRSLSISISLVAAKTAHSTTVHCGLDGRAKKHTIDTSEVIGFFFTPEYMFPGGAWPSA